MAKRIHMVLANNIKYYRFINNLTQEELSERCDLSTRYISDLENGKGNPNLNVIEKISSIFNIDYYLLFQDNKFEINIRKIYKKHK